MGQTFTFQKSHSRNSHDWNYVKSKSGRHVFLANEKGVSERIGYLIDFLYLNPRSSAKDMAAFLLTKGKSYEITDVSQPLRRMLKHGLVKQYGSGKDCAYSLTTNSKRIWAAATKVWK